MFVDSYLDTNVGDVFQKELQKHTADLIHKYSLQHLPELTKKPTPTAEQESEKSPLDILKIKTKQAESQKNPQFTIKSTNKAALEEYDLKIALYQSMHANKSFNRNHVNHRLYYALIEALIEDENVMDNGVTNTVKDYKKKHDDDEDPLPALAKEPVEEPIAEVIMDVAGDDQPPRPPTPDLEWNKHKLDWNNLEGDRYPFDLSKPLPLQGPLGYQTIAADYFFNNDLEYLKTSDPEVTYTISIMKPKANRYKIKGIEYMVPTLWSTIKYAYDKDVEKGIKHWGERRKLWYRSQVSRFSKENVYSTKAILGVKNVSVKKLHEYGHIEKIVVKRSDQQLYMFKEGDFVDLHLNDIEDMLLLAF
ncbi:hypothetical protein Tco_0246527 [Tanacetum coccineum]